MRLETGLFAGRESLIAQGSAMATVADNLANSNTPGFKEQRAEFGDLFTESTGSLFGAPQPTGNGVQIKKIASIHNQGSLEFTDRPLDFAIEGSGFFVLNDGTTTSYSRAGDFTVDADGNLVSQTGEQIMGFTEASPTTPVAINVTSASSIASPTTLATITGNLDVTTTPAAAIVAPATFKLLNDASQFHSSVSITDSLGARHEVALHFFHTAISTWQVDAYVDGSTVGGVAGVPSLLGSTNLTFDGTGQQTATGAALAITPAWSNGSIASAVSLDLSGFTSFANSSAINSVSIDGNVPGNVVGFEVDSAGIVTAQLDNGETNPIATLAIAKFNNPAGLDKIGSNRFIMGETSGDAAIGNPTVEGRGSVRGGALESSTVDPANEFINVIKFQRAYQAGSQVIQTVNDMLNTAIQIA